MSAWQWFMVATIILVTISIATGPMVNRSNHPHPWAVVSDWTLAFAVGCLVVGGLVGLIGAL